MIVRCKICKKSRTISKTTGYKESVKTYEKRRPYCNSCSRKLMFKKRDGKSLNWKGGEHVSPHGYIRIYIRELKIYVFKHRYVWEKHNGKIPRGHVIHHKDGNKLNNSIKNLQCMIKLEHDKLNTSLLKNHFNRKTKRTENLCAV